MTALTPGLFKFGSFWVKGMFSVIRLWEERKICEPLDIFSSASGPADLQYCIYKSIFFWVVVVINLQREALSSPQKLSSSNRRHAQCQHLTQELRSKELNAINLDVRQSYVKSRSKFLLTKVNAFALVLQNCGSIRLFPHYTLHSSPPPPSFFFPHCK